MKTCCGVAIKFYIFLGLFAKTRKASDSFVISVCPSVYLSSVRVGQICSHWKHFLEIWYLVIFQNLPRRSKFHHNV